LRFIARAQRGPRRHLSQDLTRVSRFVLRPSWCRGFAELILNGLFSGRSAGTPQDA
jgi:hypothetical protein